MCEYELCLIFSLGVIFIFFVLSSDLCNIGVDIDLRCIIILIARIILNKKSLIS